MKPIDMIHRLIQPLAAALVLFASLSCSRDWSGRDEGRMTVSATPDVITPATRSVLPETSSFEDTVHEATFFAFNASSGLLEEAVHTTGGSVTLTLDRNASHRIYCLVNMGDLSGAAPVRESLMGDLSYTIPSYGDLSSRGMPMAGVAECGGGASATVAVRRLLAKIFITLDKSGISDGGWPESFYYTDIAIKNVPRRLYPFNAGGSFARNADDLFEEQTEFETIRESNTQWVSSERVFYVPENAQGVLLPGNAEQMDKSMSNPDLSGQGRSELCTYVELHALKDYDDADGVRADLTYRFLPGGDATTDFSLEGGKTYRITLKLTWNGMFVQGNWMVSRSGWIDTRRLWVSAERYGPYVSAISLSVPVGASWYPFYVFFSPMGDTPDPNDNFHYAHGWNFSLDGVAARSLYGDVTDADGVSVEHDDSGWCTAYGVTVPADLGLVGETRRVRVFTVDGQHSATVDLNLILPTIILDRYEVMRRYDEWGASGRFTVSVSGGTVPLADIAVSSDNGLLRVVSYDGTTGTAVLEWTSQNDGTTMRSASVTFAGLGVQAVCSVYQGTRSAFVIDDDDDGGEGDNNYD